MLANDFGRITGKPEVNCFFVTILFSLGASWVFSERFGLEVGEPPFDLSYPEAIFRRFSNPRSTPELRVLRDI